MSYEDRINQIEQEIQNFNIETAMEFIQNPEIMKDPYGGTYMKRRKEVAEKIYKIVYGEFDSMEKRISELEEANKILLERVRSVEK